MRRTVLLSLLAGLAGALAPAASAGITCEPVGPVPGYGPVCTVTCVLKHEPTVDPERAPVVDLGRPSCMDEDA